MAAMAARRYSLGDPSTDTVAPGRLQHMTHAKISFERTLPREVSTPRDLPMALRSGAPTRREPAQFVLDVQPVTVTSLNIPFLNLVWTLIKLALAAVPALIIFGVVVWGCLTLYSTLAPDLYRLANAVAGPGAGKTP